MALGRVKVSAAGARFHEYLFVMYLVPSVTLPTPTYNTIHRAPKKIPVVRLALYSH